MVRALLLVLMLLCSSANAAVSYTLSGTILIVTITGNAKQTIEISGSKSEGGLVYTPEPGGDYVILDDNYVTEIWILVHTDYKATCSGTDITYTDHATVSEADAFKFTFYGCSGSGSEDSICTGGARDVFYMFGGTNMVASGRGNDAIDTQGESYVFSGQGELDNNLPPWYGDYIYWEGTCVVFTADDTQGNYYEEDLINPGYGSGLTYYHSGPLTGWN